MPSLDQHQSLEFVKGLYLGNAGAGKTGSLDSLVAAGYQLRIYDFDNLLGSLVQQVLKNNPTKVKNIAFQTFTDKMKSKDTMIVRVGQGAGLMKVLPFTDGTPTAFVTGMKQLTKWKTETEDFGDPGTWGKNVVVVIDSFTNLCQAAFRYVQAMNPAGADPRQDYGVAQALVMNTLMLLFSEQMRTNVLVLAHIQYRENEMELVKGFPRAIGAAIADQVAVYFNCVFMAEASGSGKNIKRVIRTNSNGVVDLKNPISFKLEDTLPLETGLATIFHALTGYTPEKGT